jgi:hypothetical protein
MATIYAEWQLYMPNGTLYRNKLRLDKITSDLNLLYDLHHTNSITLNYVIETMASMSSGSKDYLHHKEIVAWRTTRSNTMANNILKMKKLIIRYSRRPHFKPKLATINERF